MLINFSVKIRHAMPQSGPVVGLVEVAGDASTFDGSSRRDSGALACVQLPRQSTPLTGRGIVRADQPDAAENRVTSCDLQLLVDDAAEPVSSEHADACPRTRLCAACGRALVQGSVRSVRVEMLHILASTPSRWRGPVTLLTC
jgi:hypothetical protein